MPFQQIAAEAVLAEAGLYRRLFDSLPLPTLRVDHHGFIQEANALASDYLGLSRQTALQRRSALQFFDEDSRKKLYWRLTDRSTTQPLMLRQAQLRLEGERSVPCDIHIVHLDATGFETPQSLLVMVDQSLEQELRDSEQALRAQTQRLSEVVWASDSGIWDWDLKADRVTVNERWAEILGRAHDELEDLDSEQWGRLIHPEDRAIGQTVMADLRGRRSISFDVRLRMAHRHGGWVWVQSRGRVLEWTPDDRPSRIAGAILDVSAQKAQEDALLAASAAAEAASRAKDDFIANLSHEVRTPLNSVLGLAELLAGSRLDERQREQVEQLRRSASTLMATLNDLLDHAKLEAGNLLVERIPLSIREVMGNVMALFSHQAEAAGLVLTGKVDAGVPALLLGDPLRLQQVLNNLVSNALKFTPAGSVAVRIGGRRLAQGRRYQLRIEVRDTGIGMSTAAQAGLFTPFHQADASITRRYGGTGLGLSICKKLVALMGGEIGVESEPGVGSTFWARVPLVLEAGPELQAPLWEQASSTAPAPDAGPACQPLPPPVLAALAPRLGRLDAELQRQELRALDEARALLPAVPDEHQGDIAALCRMIEAYDFDRARQRLALLTANENSA